jgi:transcriptional regulator with XRE-family HTH domain
VSEQDRESGKRTRRRKRSTGDPTLGLRIRKARIKAGLSQEQAAHQIERSDRWLLEVENGHADPGYGDLARLAPVLQVEFEELVVGEADAKREKRMNAPAMRHPEITGPPDTAMMGGDGVHPADQRLEELRRRGFLQAGLVMTGGVVLGLWPAFEECADGSDIAALRRGLLHLGPGPGTMVELPDLAELRHEVDAASAATQASRYSSALRVISSILTRARVAAKEMNGPERATSLQVLAQAYHVHVSILRKRGDTHLAVLAADRALAAAQESGDPGTIASAASFLCDVLGDCRHYQQAIDLCTQVSAAVQPEVARRDDPSRLSVYGRLLLSGAEAAAQAGDRGLSDDFYREADGMARLLGGDANHRFTAFGPTNVTVHRVHAAIVLGDGESAIRLARALDLSRLPVLERQAHHLMDVAIAHGLTDNPELALNTLISAEQIAPEEVRLDPGARALVDELARRNRHHGSQLDALTQRIHGAQTR